MTLRLTDEQDRTLTELAARQGVSKNDIVIKALSELSERDERAQLIDDAVDDLMRRYPKTIQRLGE